MALGNYTNSFLGNGSHGAVSDPSSVGLDVFAMALVGFAGVTAGFLLVFCLQGVCSSRSRGVSAQAHLEKSPQFATSLNSVMTDPESGASSDGLLAFQN